MSVIYDITTDTTTFIDDPVPTQAEIDAGVAEAVRHKRNIFLEMYVDPVVSNPLRWADMSIEDQNAWLQYRTDLLNVPSQSGFPHNVTWPTKP
jgi:hypothetical protein